MSEINWEVEHERFMTLVVPPNAQGGEASVLAVGTSAR